MRGGIKIDTNFWAEMVFDSATNAPLAYFETNLFGILFYSNQWINYFPFSFLSQTVFVLMPGRQPFNFHLCRNMVKHSDLVNPPIKVNWQLLFVLVCSFIIHVYANIKIKLYKYKKRHSVYIISMAEFIKNIGIMDIDKNSMSSLALNTANVILFGSTFVFSTFVNNMDPLRSNEFPFYLIIYSYNLVFPCTLNWNNHSSILF